MQSTLSNRQLGYLSLTISPKQDHGSSAELSSVTSSFDASMMLKRRFKEEGTGPEEEASLVLSRPWRTVRGSGMVQATTQIWPLSV